MTNNSDLVEQMAALQEQIPEVMAHFGALREAVGRNGVLSARTKRLMMLAVSVAQRCEPCIRTHVKGAVELAASRAEILETLGVAILTAGGPAAAYSATVVLQLLDELKVK